MDVETLDAGRLRMYRAFGLQISSAIDLPELASSHDAVAEPAGLHIVRGAVPPVPGGAHRVEAGVFVADGQVWFETPAGRYHAAEGRRITATPAPGASARDVRLYLLGTMIGAILHQRGVLPLHANAIAVGRDAVAFAGPSGAGKSTLAAFFRQAGYGILSDDVCALTFDGEGRPWAAPGSARIKLWRDTLVALGQNPDDVDRIADTMDKFSLPLAARPAVPTRLGRLYCLDPEPTSELSATRLTGPEAANAVLSNVYRWSLAKALGRAPSLFAQAMRVVEHCEIVSLRIPRGLDRLPGVVGTLSDVTTGTLPV